MNRNKTDTVTDTIKSELSKDDLLRYVELDLWAKFQERLWKLVGVVLTVVTVLGLLGVPYYIKNEVTSHLLEREKEFTQRTNEVLEYSKVLAILRARYDGERYCFDGDVLRLVNALDKIEDKDQAKKNPDVDNGPSFLDPRSELVSLISRPDFSEVVDGSASARNPLVIPENMKLKQVLPPTVFTLSKSGMTLQTGDKDPHPIRNGSYEGTIKDLKYRIAVLEAWRRSIEEMQNQMLSVGNNFNEAKTQEPVTAESLQYKDFQRLFATALSSVVNGFLTKEERAEFEQWQSLYTLGYKVNYVSPAPSPKDATGR
jgi:hypothetical protein